MTAPTRLLGAVDEYQYGTIVTDVYEHIPDLLYPNSVRVYAEMRRDSRLTSILDGYGLQLRRAQWQLDGSGCRPAVTQFVADCLGLNVVGRDKASGARRRGVSWSDHLRSSLLSQVWGHYAFEMEAEIDASGRARLTTLAERIPATISAIHADPKTGALLGVDQLLTTREKSPQIRADRLVFYSRNREGNGWQGTSLIRSAYAPWLLKREMMRVAAISNRRWGAGVPVAQALPGTNPTSGQMQEAQRLASSARAGDQAGASMPPGFRLDIVGLSGSIPDTLGFIRFLNQEIAQATMMQHLDLGTSESGSRALGTAFIDSWTLSLESEAETIADTITRQGAARIVDWNWGEDEPVPRVVVSGIGSRREVTAESLQLLMTSGALSADPGLEAWVRREYRLPEREQPARPVVVSAPEIPAPAATTTAASTARPRARARRKQSSGQLSLFNAADPEPDPAAVQEAWEQTRTDLMGEWPEQAQAMVDELAAQAEQAAGDGDLGALGTLAVSAAVGAALAAFLAGWAATVATGAVAQVAAEAAAQGVTVVVPSDAGEQRARDGATAAAGVIAAGYATGAARTALLNAGEDTDPEAVAAAVREHLNDLSTSERGWVTDNAGAALSAAQNAGRMAALNIADPPPTALRAVEVNDTNRCEPCSDVADTEFTDLTEALAAYPVAGHVHCLGGLRCRGYLFPIWR